MRVVFASSSSVYGTAESYPLLEDGRLTPVSPYGVSKLACESLASAYGQSAGLDAVGLVLLGVRAKATAGHGVRPGLRLAGSTPPVHLLGDGGQTRDFTYVGDIVEATLRAMEHGTSGLAYNIGGGSEVSLLDALGLCERIVGQPLDLHRGPPVAGDARRTIADISLASADLGWTPAHVAGGWPPRPGRERRGAGARA